MSVLKWNFFPKNGHSKMNFVRDTFFRPPKLGAKSPPMRISMLIGQDPYWIYGVQFGNEGPV